MRGLHQVGALFIALCIGLSAAASPDTGYSEQGTELCSSCHDTGEHSIVDSMQASAHGQSQQHSPMSKKGCEHCHGPSAAHTQAPTKKKPGVSFGPTWTDSIEAQNGACLGCHDKKATQHWAKGVHEQAKLTCVTCHNAHKEDVVLDAGTQSQVCTGCHKEQKLGVHQHKKALAKNPPCSSCHEPHGNSKALVTLLENRSLGCAHCHDLKAMQSSAKVTEKAKTYHKAMALKDRTCIDCHQSVAHVALDEIPAPKLSASEQITLFQPGQANYDWILSDHPGSQPFRQGRNCTQCHQGEQEAMGKKLTAEGVAGSLQAKLNFTVEKNNLLVTVRWKAAVEKASVALMLDDGSDEQFTRAGCWAACHNDLPGQDRNRGQAITKYLSASLQQQRSVGRYAVPHDDNALQTMMEQGHYVEMWRAKLNGGALETASSYQILAARSPDEKPVANVNASYKNGEWTVQFRKPLTGQGKAIVKGKEFTFGIAIHGEDASKSAHWVSLPMTFSLDTDGVDYPVKAK